MYQGDVETLRVQLIGLGLGGASLEEGLARLVCRAPSSRPRRREGVKVAGGLPLWRVRTPDRRPRGWHVRARPISGPPPQASGCRPSPRRRRPPKERPREGGRGSPAQDPARAERENRFRLRDPASGFPVEAALWLTPAAVESLRWDEFRRSRACHLRGGAASGKRFGGDAGRCTERPGGEGHDDWVGSRDRRPGHSRGWPGRGLGRHRRRLRGDLRYRPLRGLGLPAWRVEDDHDIDAWNRWSHNRNS